MTATCLSAAFLNHKKKKKKKIGQVPANEMFFLPGGYSEVGPPLLVFLKTLIWGCHSPINQRYSCVSTNTEGGRETLERRRGREETDSQDLDEPWEKRGLVEEKQKCLRTFLCDYTELDKSRHSYRLFFSPLCVLSPKVNFTKVNNTFVFYLFPVVSRLFFFFFLL